VRAQSRHESVRILLSGVLTVTMVLVALPQSSAQSRQAGPSHSAATDHHQFFERYCASCHNERLKSGDLNLASADSSQPGAMPQFWERVVRKLRTGVMPPPAAQQPPDADRKEILTWLETSLDAASASRPNPGRTETLRRLNRTEYRNSIRALLALDIDASALLPADESGYGFDNVNVGDLPPALLSRYIDAARKIGRLAVGIGGEPAAETFNAAPDLTQEDQLPGMPIGSRGGMMRCFTFPQDGEYDIQIFLARNLENIVAGLRDGRAHQLLVLVDRDPVKTFTVQKSPKGDDTVADKDLKARIAVTAGPHMIGVTFVKEASSLTETFRQPAEARYNDRRYPRTSPGIAQFSIAGPYGSQGAGDTPSRRRLFTCRPSGTNRADEEKCAVSILSTVMRRAYRRPVVRADADKPMGFYRRARANADFDAGIAAALSAILSSPEFLFRVETDPKKTPLGGAYKISDLDLASRLSFFLWSSIPDDELLDSAIRGKLSQPVELERQFRRMLADERSYNLATNFAGQWLRLRNIDSLAPSTILFRDFDDNLRQALRQETELFFDSIVREDRSALTFIRSDYTFLNERLARHYGISGVYGSRFRRVTLMRESRRGGLLRQGSVLAVTSYATRTSPVLRGVLVLRNIIGAPPPSPPPNVPALDESTMAANLSMRQRLAAHRSNTACASCHRTIDPVGFALENFNAVGQWRDVDADGKPVDASGSVPGVAEFRGIDGLENALLARPDLFVTSLTENLMTFALGRGIEYYDAPAIRGVVRESANDEYRFSSLILGIVRSVPFQMRRVESNEAIAAGGTPKSPGTQ
jgi:mono/diheme cytochrome c family protein